MIKRDVLLQHLHRLTRFRAVTIFFFPLFFEQISILRKNCGTRFFEVSSLLFFSLSFFSFFFLRLDLQAFENWSRVHNRLSDRRNYIRGSYLPIGPPSNIDFPSRV